MTLATRLWIACAALLLGGAMLAAREYQEGVQARAHAPAIVQAALPRIALSPVRADEIDKIELLEPQSDGDNPPEITLQRDSGGWSLSAPLRARASASKVQALLDNLTSLRLGEAVGVVPTALERYGLTDAQAFHVRAWKGRERAFDLYFGKSSARGELLRLAQSNEIYTIGSQGPGSYSGFLYTRPLRSWRDANLFQFDPADAVRISIQNAHGEFRFDRAGSSWTSTPPWPRFDPSRVDTFLEAYRSLAADEFGSDEARAGSGLDHAERTGGTLEITLKTGKTLGLRVGNRAHGPNTWGIRDSRWATRVAGDGSLVALALWTTDWLTTGAVAFEARAR